MLPVDQLLNNTRLNWNEDYVQEQSDLIGRAQAVAKECLKKAADADKQRWDRRAKAGPIPVGNRVLVKQCAFIGRHKLSNHYGEASYVVVNANTDQNLYEIRPVHGGPTRWVNRKLLVQDPRAGVHDQPVGLSVLPQVEDSDVDEDVAEEESEETEAAAGVADLSADKPVCRRSSRLNKGRHANPAHWPSDRN